MKSGSIKPKLRKPVKLKHSFAWLLLHMAVPLVWGQPPEHHLDQYNKVKFEHLSIEQGDVAGILQDSKGYMWFSTSNGLKKYDGYSFTTYKHDPEDSTTISENSLNIIWEDKEGTIWLGTSEGGLSKFDPYKNQFIHYRPFQSDHVACNDGSVTAINEDSEGTIWIGHEGGKLTRFDKKTEKFFSEDYSSMLATPADTSLGIARYISAIIKDKEGNLWIANNKIGLHRLNHTADKANKGSQVNFTHFRQHSMGAKPFSSYLIRSIYQDHAGMIWLCTANGLNQFNPATGKVTSYFHDPNNLNSISHNDVTDIVEDHQGNLWIATLYGLNKLNKERTAFTAYFQDHANPSSLSSNDIGMLYIDRSGIIWVVTTAGIDKIYPDQKPFLLYRHNPFITNSLSDNVARCIWEDKAGIAWIGTVAGGLNAFDRRTGQFTHYRHDPQDAKSLPNDLVSSILEDQDGNLWIATAKRLRGTLSILNRQTGEFTHYAGDSALYPSLGNYAIRYMYEDRQGILWLCTTNGISSFDRKTGEATHYPPDATNPDAISSESTYTIIEDRRGDLWIGTDGNALNRFDRKTGKFTHYKTDKNASGSISSGNVRSIYEDSLGMLWIGTVGGGLCRFNPENEIFTTFTEKQGLPGHTVFSIQQDHDGNLWLGTNNGLSKFNPSTMTFTNYDVNDGLQSNHFAMNGNQNGGSFKGKDGTLYFVGINGMNVFNPRHIQVNRQIPPVVITHFRLFDKLLPGTNELEKIQLSYHENFFSFEFAALNYINTHKNQYAYKLEGFDKDWIYSGNRRYVSYTNLNPGEYIFKVKGSNNDGRWNEQGASIKIIIHPPWWQTWWAYSLYGMLAIGFLYGLRQHTVKREKLKHELKLKKLEAEKMHEIDQMKSRFFANISHEFRTPLTLILGPLERLNSQPAFAQEHPLFSIMQRNAQRLLHLINQLLDLSKLEVGSMKVEAKPADLVSFLKITLLSFTSLAESRHIQYHVQYPVEHPTVYFDADKLEKIIVNLLSNAFKFTPAGGEITVTAGFTTAEERSIPANFSKAGSSSRVKLLVLKVEDSGPGITEEQQGKIFDRFYQADTSHTREQEGTGIGLSLVKELVELHEGEIVVESQPEQGSCFTVRLPLLMAEYEQITAGEFALQNDHENRTSIKTADHEVQVNQTSVSEMVEPSTGIPIVLIVEDNADIRQFIRQHLYPFYQTIEACDGVQGYSKAVETIPDLILSDVMMPLMDGVELCRKLKQDEKTAHVPVILLTAKASGADKIEGLETGADDYIIKPFEADELLVRIKNLIDSRKKLREYFSRQITLEPKSITVTSVDEQFLQRVMQILEAHIADTAFSVEDFGKEVGMSRMQLHRKLKALTDQSPGEFIRSFRLKRAVVLLSKNYGNISEVAFSVGFQEPSYFTKCFREYFGQAPSEYLASHTPSSSP